MAIIDRYNSFTDQGNGTAFQSLAGITTRTRSTNGIDLGAAGDGHGKDNYVVVRANNLATGTAGSAVTINLETHTSSDFSSARTVIATISTTIGALTAGKEFRIPVPAGKLRYLELTFTAATSLTVQIQAEIRNDIQVNDFKTSAAGQPA